MSISEAAIVLGTSTHAIRCQAREGRLASREENGTLYVCLAGHHGDRGGSPTSASTRGADRGERRATGRARLAKIVLTTACVLGLGGLTGASAYRFLDSRHKQAVDDMLATNARANRALADKLEAQRLQSITLTRRLHEERMGVKRASEDVAHLSSQVEQAAARLRQLERELADESERRAALVAQRMELVHERDQLTQELAEMMKHLAVARKQLNESQHELAQARSRLAALEPHPQASPLPREMLEEFGQQEHRSPPRDPTGNSQERLESSTRPAYAAASSHDARHERPSPAGGRAVAHPPRLTTVVPQDSEAFVSPE